MSWWLLALFICGTWLVWLVACIIGVAADVRERKKPMRSGVSIFPGIPVFPLAFLILAKLIDTAAAPWGTRIIAGFHLVFLGLLLITIARDLYRWLKAPPTHERSPQPRQH